LPTTLYIAPCGRAKVWDATPERGPTPAGEAYTGTFAGAAARYARSTGQPWVILSAKYGFLRPHDLVPGPYNTTFLKRTPDVVQLGTLVQQVHLLQLAQFSDVAVLAGSAYVSRARDAFTGLGCTVRAPLSGLGGMGYMVSRLVHARQAGERL